MVDLSRLLPGPLAAHLLADLGARVIKVEEPILGDPVRYAPPKKGETSALAALLLTGVESIALDLKTEAGRQVLNRLLERADVLLETLRPGTLERLLGMGPQELTGRHPRLVVCSLSGFGASGPYASRAGHDLTYQALAGTLAATEELAAAPAVPLADLAGAWSAVSSILAALLQRGRTGQGTVIDASLFDAAVHANLTAWAAEVERPHGAGEPLQLTGRLPCYRIYDTSDGGHLALAALEPHFWKRFCRAAGRSDLEDRHLDPSPEARAEVARLVASRTREAWRRLMEEEDIPAEPVLSAAEAAGHPQTKARGVLGERDGLPSLAFPAVIGGRRPRARRRFPALGEHTRTLLAELGFEGGFLARMKRGRGVGKEWSLKRLLARWFGP